MNGTTQIKIAGFDGNTIQATITGEQYNKLTSCMLFLWSRKGEILFISGSMDGIKILGCNKVMNCEEAVLPTDEIEIIWCAKSEINRIKTELISRYKPKYNHNRVRESRHSA